MRFHMMEAIVRVAAESKKSKAKEALNSGLFFSGTGEQVGRKALQSGAGLSCCCLE